jgi:allantoinase
MLVVRSTRVLLPGGMQPASVHIEDGKILRVDQAIPQGAEVHDAGDAIVMAGLVDTHVHINEPGRTEWEGFETATRAAAAGGVTTLVDMPLNSVPPTTTLAGFEAKLAAMHGKLWVDVGLCGGVVPGNAGELEAIREAGALGFKCFLTHSGVDEFPDVSEEDLARAMPILTRTGAPLLVHAELSGPIDRVLRTGQEDARKYATYLESRPKDAENEAVDLMLRLARVHGTRSHIVHLSSADALVLMRKARDEKIPLRAETCPHYLYLTAEEIPDGATEYKCAPPIRDRHNRDRLWEALAEGLVEQVVTDHSPSSPSLKCSGSGDFMKAWGGISSLQLGLAVVWSSGRARFEDITRWMSQSPAALVGLDTRKGKIAPGYDADLAIWDPDRVFEVIADLLQHRHKLTPYAGKKLHGRVLSTYVRGRRVYHDGQFSGPHGEWIRA